MQLHQLQSKTARRYSKRVARGGTRGKTAGRGTKGQKARAGHRIRPEVRDDIKRIPKLRGHGKNRARTINDGTVKPRIVNLVQLEAAFNAGESVTPQALVAKGLVARHSGKTPAVKVLGTGALTKKLTVTGCEMSAGARERIEQAGGSVAA